MNNSITAQDELAIPRLPRVHLPRERIWQKLDDACRNAVTLLVAPAGAGKTLGVSGWLRRGGQAPDRAVWMTGTPGLTPDELAKALDVAGAGKEGESPRLVVVDDAHRLPREAVQLIDDRLNGEPASLRLLLLSREDLPLTRLVPELLGHFTVLRGDCLRLTSSESDELISRVSGSSSREVLDAVRDQADGWCAAAVLAARTVGTASDLTAAVRRLRESFVSIAALMADEVFDSLTPRQRHLVLCICGEDAVDAATAAGLSQDDQAARLLTELESTGLLVRRISGAPGAGQDCRDGAGTATARTDEIVENRTRFRPHPLVERICQQRLADDGVEAARARATVVRAVATDLARGQLSGAFARLVRVGADDEAAAILARYGIRLVLDPDPSDLVGDFLRTRPEAVDANPAAWFPMALRCWTADDMDGVRHWSGRILDIEPGPRLPVPGTVDARDARVACLRLWRAQLGMEPVHAALGHARAVFDAAQHAESWHDDDADLLPILACEIGVVQNWTGELVSAEGHLTRAANLGQGRGLPAMVVVSLSHLALTQYMRGRERACSDLAADALALSIASGVRLAHASSRASLARFLGRLADVPSRTDDDVGSTAGGADSAVHTADHCARFWFLIQDARRAAVAGDVARGQRILGAPRDVSRMTRSGLPDHLRVTLLVERALLAALASDTTALALLRDELAGFGAVGEAALVDGLRADRAGERARAAAAFETAAGDAAYAQPATRAMALIWRAQLLDALGMADEAATTLAQGVAATEERRNAMPFLGWIRQGTPVHVLLKRHAARTHSIWARELLGAGRGRPTLTAHFDAVTLTPAEERGGAPTGVAAPRLSARESEVLGQLARGATYSDIATSLFVSENTVKTHVSSLYAKLGAGRRSEALVTARSLHLL